jgi:hypothetical protein
MTRYNDDIWFGTAANVAVIGQTSSGGTTGCEFDLDPCDQTTRVNVVEGGMSQYPGVPQQLRTYLGDWRPPEVRVYNVTSGTQTNLTPASDLLIGQTLGLRVAGTYKGVVLLAGPVRYGLGLNMFAFDASTKRFIGSRAFPQYSNARKFLVAANNLYLGVQTSDGKGAVLRWTGTLASPFSFMTVGSLDNDAANIVEHSGRLYVATWSASGQSSLAGPPLLELAASTLSSTYQLGTAFGDSLFASFSQSAPSGIWMSPTIPYGGLTAANASQWKKVWKITDYEPETSIAATQLVGDLASYGGYLYWGTMTPPWQAFQAFAKAYGTPDNSQIPVIMQNIQRASTLFRCQQPGTTAVQVLYGRSPLSKYNPTTKTFAPVKVPPGIYGTAGFGYPTNVYTWTMAVYQGLLFVGTLDSGGGCTTPRSDGGDLYVFKDNTSPAKPFTVDGFGHDFNVTGIRTMVPASDGLFVGIASRANLSPDGGWKLFKINQK